MTFEDALAKQVTELADTMGQHTETCKALANDEPCVECATAKGALLALACVSQAIIDAGLSELEEAA